MSQKLRIPGTAIATGAKKDELKKEDFALPLSIDVQEVVDLTAAREAGEAVTVDLEPPPEGGEERHSGQVCEVELEGGITLWLRPGSLYRDFQGREARGVAQAGREDIWEISPAFSRRGEDQRGVAQNRIRRLAVYRWQRTAPPPPAPPARGKARGVGGAVAGAALDAAAGFVAGKAAQPVAHAAERHLLGNEPGLYRVDLGNQSDITPVTGFTADGPILLFLHGTMSSFKGSFYGLWDAKNSEGADALRQMARRYNHAYAWEHRTLTQSPIENALELAEKLPAGTRLHLVSHSRGGLVGDLLCLGQQVQGAEALSSKRIREIFELAAGGSTDGTLSKAHADQAEQLAKLIELLKKNSITVERFVRVACPARGTTLASGKLDRWLSVVKILNDLVLPFNFPLQLLIALIAEHDDPAQLPGLEAMMPGSPLVRALNFPALQVTADLSVISGDTESKGVFGRLKELMLDQFFEDECDIVVNTGAMFGGLKRADGGRFHLDSGQEVNHFSYFKNPETVRMLVAGLLRSDNSDGGFRPIVTAPEKEPARAIVRRAPQGTLPVVFVLPGIMGSTLKSGDNRIWLGKLALMLGKFGKLSIERDVTPEEPFEEYYGELMEMLRESHEVVPFPYDWRRSILQAGESLAQQITARLDDIDQRRSNQPVRILAHSMGGLVARAMIAQKPEVWRRMTAHEGSRLIMLGTPNGGSYEIVRLLTGYASALQQLALLDFTRNWAELLEIIVRFPGVLELLPIENDFQYYREDIWQELKNKDDEMTGYKVELPTAADLKQARRTWERILAAPLDSQRTFYVAGQAKETPVAWREEIIRDPEHVREDSRTIVFEATARGDGRVPWESGIPLNVRTWFLPEVEHGDMPAHAEAFPAYLQLLHTGSTDRLPTTPPAAMRSAAAEQRVPLAREVPPVLPDERELAGSLLGSSSSRRRKKPVRPATTTHLSITHGDISYALYPVCVGHYAGDTIVSAEDYLDRALNRRLRERVLLGLYPGKLGTCEVVLNPQKNAKPAGAIVIGLGQVGELSPGALETAFTQAVLQYAIHVAECEDDRFGVLSGVPRSAKITTLLIGTGAGGMAVRDSIEAILQGVAAANRLICDQGLSGKICIDAVEFMELWQDVAIQAAQDLERVLLDGSLPGTFIWNDRQVNIGEGGRRRAQFEEPPNWWHRLEIVHDPKNNELRFTALTNRARAERSLVTGQLQLADDLIRRTIADTSRDARTAHALFEMLIPNRLKELAPNQYDVVLVVDERSGSYPWELLEDRWNKIDRPPAVTAGMLRQLKTDIFREQPVTTLEDTVYVVGDPFLTGTAATLFPMLEGAMKEARAVADLLQQSGFTVSRQIRTDAQAILSGLHDNGYRILHLAGHGVHEHQIPIPPKKPTCDECEQPLPLQTKQVSGMVIGDGMFLTPGDVEQMRKVPELVFINCCHLGSLAAGQQSDERMRVNRLAANLAAQFIRMGVKAVVAAGWAVDDAAAETFATSFYRHLLAGDSYGDSVRAAREETFSRHSTSNTWGAYQCYGDPGFRLRPPAEHKKAAGRRQYVLPAQAVTDLHNMTNGIRMGSGSAGQLETVARAISEADESWLARPDVAAALGMAYGELGCFDKAIGHLDRALAGEKADFPLLVLEQRANFKTRWAVDFSRSGKGTAGSPSPEELIAEAIEDIERLMKFTPAAETAERLSLMGSAYKRQAWVTQGEKRKESLRKMAEQYRKAHERKFDKARNKLDTYPLINWLAAEILLKWYGEKSGVTPAAIREWCESARSLAEERNRQKPTFWNSVVLSECDMVQALAENDLPKHKERIVSEYRQAKARGASPREFGSVVEHLKFLEEMMEGAKSKNSVQQTAALREIVAQLAPLAESDSGT